MTKETIEQVSMPEPNSGCWLWLGALDDDGYGRRMVNGKHVKAHRVSWQLFNGPIPYGLLVLHRCDTPCCVNPAHLFLGNHKDNAEDRDRKKRRRPPVGALNPAARLTAEQATAVFYATGSLRRIGSTFGIPHQQVLRIKKGKSWACLGLAAKEN